MKIVMVSGDYLPNIGGIASHIYNLSFSLLKTGEQVIILQPIEADKFDCVIEQQDGFPLVYKALYPKFKNRFLRIAARVYSLLRTFSRIENNFGFIDIIHQHDYFLSTFFCILMSINHHWVWTNHSSNFLMDIENRNSTKIILKLLHSRNKGLISVSQELLGKTNLVLRKKNSVYIQNGVNLERFNPSVKSERGRYGLSENDFVILCPRRMVAKNGVIYMAEAVSIIHQQKTDFHLRFIFTGNEIAFGTDSEYIQQVTNILNPYIKDGTVILLGNIDPFEMPKIYALADIIVMPSLIEAVSLAALESLALGKPVIATNVGGLPEIIFDEVTGLLIHPKDPQALANSILRLYGNRELREKIAAGGLNLVQEYSWDIIAQKTLSLYQKALNN